MTQLKDLKLIYKQFLNLCDEIKEFIEQGDLKSAFYKIEAKSALTRKLMTARKTVEVPDEKKNELEELDALVLQKEKEVLEFSKSIQSALKNQLSTVNKKVKLQSKYEAQQESTGGFYLDVEE